MLSLNNSAIAWTVAIVAIATGLAFVGNSSDDISHTGNNVNEVVVRQTLQSSDENDMNPLSQPSSTFHIDTSKSVYVINEEIMILGHVEEIEKRGMPVIMQILSPNNELVSIAQLKLRADGSFGDLVATGGSIWNNEGEYMIRAFYDGNNAKTSFNLIK